MSVSENPEILGIWSRGGGGHKAAWDAYAQRVGSKGVTIKNSQGQEEIIQGKNKVVAYDMMDKGLLGDCDNILAWLFLIFTWQTIGDYCAKQWDSAQQSGDVAKLTDIASKQWIAEILFYWIVYFKVKSRIKEMNVLPKVVVSTQALCTSAIAHAILAVNKERGSSIQLHHYMTDMATKKSTHFFQSLSAIGKNEELCKLYTLHVSSATKLQSKDEEVIRTNCQGIKFEWIRHADFPIREAFLDVGKINEQLDQNVAQLQIKVNSSHGFPDALDENEAILTGLNPHVAESMVREEATADSNGFLQIPVKQEDKVAFLMLGSQPSKQAVLDWIKSLTLTAALKQQLEDTENPTQHYFFVFCGAPEATPMSEKEKIAAGISVDETKYKYKKNELLRNVEAHLKQLKEEGKLPDNFNVIPFTFQDDKALAPLIARSDLTITRSGGSTCFELIHLHESAEEGLIPKRENRLSIVHSEGMHKGNIDMYRSQKAKEHLIAGLLGMGSGTNIETNISTVEWQEIREEILHIAKDKGLDQEKVEELLAFFHPDSLDQGSTTLSPENTITLKKLSEALESYLQRKNAFIPLTEQEKEEMISAKMAHLQEKQKYQEMDASKLRKIAIEKLLIEQGTCVWEAGNAKYLGDVIGAQVSNPEYAQESIAKHFFEIEIEENEVSKRNEPRTQTDLSSLHASQSMVRRQFVRTNSIPLISA